MLESFIRSEHKTWDTGTHFEVVIDDCYKMKGRQFCPTDIILDVGANIGLFSGLALELGAGLVISVEASPMNYRRLAQNLAPYGRRVELHNAAVWRSDWPTCKLHLNEDIPDGNTGGISVLPNVGATEVDTIGLDTLIGDRTMTFLKVDCEGSEFPILYTSKRLGQVKEITIEVHPIEHLIKPEGNVRPGQNNPASLTAYLQEQGFKVVNESRSGMGDGWAYLRCTR